MIYDFWAWDLKDLVAFICSFLEANNQVKKNSRLKKKKPRRLED